MLETSDRLDQLVGEHAKEFQPSEDDATFLAGAVNADMPYKHESDNDDNQMELMCRICHNPAELSELIVPCGCTGTMKYVHRSCLDAWRGHNPRNAWQCGVCQEPYAHVKVLPWGSAVVKYIFRHLAMWPFQRAVWIKGGPIRRMLTCLVEDQNPACCALRLGAWAVVLCASIIRTRLLFLIIAASHEFIMGIDRALDPMLFPEPVLGFLYSNFPGLCGFGHLGISDALSDILNSARLDAQRLRNSTHLCEFAMFSNFCTASNEAGLDELDSTKLMEFATRATSQLLSGLLSNIALPSTIDDIVLGVFFLSLDVYIFDTFHHYHENGLLRLLRRVPSAWSDLLVLHQTFVPQLDHAPAIFLFFLPVCAYAARWSLAALGVMPMDVVPFPSHITLHLWLAILVVGILLAVSVLIDLVQEDFGRWYVDHTAVEIPVIQADRPERAMEQLAGEVVAPVGQSVLDGQLRPCSVSDSMVDHRSMLAKTKLASVVDASLVNDTVSLGESARKHELATTSEICEASSSAHLLQEDLQCSTRTEATYDSETSETERDASFGARMTSTILSFSSEESHVQTSSFQACC